MKYILLLALVGVLSVCQPALAWDVHKRSGETELRYQQRRLHHAETALVWLHHRTRWFTRRSYFHYSRAVADYVWLKETAQRKINELTPTPLLPTSLPQIAFWNCVASGWSGGAPGVGHYVSSGEGGTTSVDPSGTYYGRYQMDWSFMHHHGADMLAKYHGEDATHWTLAEQTLVAERGYQVQGSGAWPNTAPGCVFLRT